MQARTTIGNKTFSLALGISVAALWPCASLSAGVVPSIQGLGDLPGGGFASIARATSADGSVIVGIGSPGFGDAAFLWTKDDGMHSLQDMLANDLGLDLMGWQLLQALDISADGLTIVGRGINPDGFGEAWIATIPEPATLSLLAFGGLLFPRRKR